MTFIKRFCLSATAALALCAGLPAHAQEQKALSSVEISSFFDKFEQSIVRYVEAGDFDSLMAYTMQTIADEAQFYAVIESYSSEERKTLNVFTVNKEDVTKIGSVVLGILSGPQGQHPTIEDYALDIELINVVPAGPDAATVTVSFTENATLFLPGSTDTEATAEGNPQLTAASQSISMEAKADCQMLVRRAAEGEQLLLGLTACTATIRH